MKCDFVKLFFVSHTLTEVIFGKIYLHLKSPLFWVFNLSWGSDLAETWAGHESNIKICY